ncbi:hypothetical protein GM920_17325 [Pedobacter sp. LMG 31462]|uniref:Glycosyl hydrolase family 95 N-terminal domain-containing protein n=2 Tax=Pedobacter gandavensis TaxID=2679963 RepID=A0ABR6EZF2_9SPHI|nr:hypothetical protein [Pedobacter gandavensis]
MLLFAISLCSLTLFLQTKIGSKKWVAWSAKPALDWQDAFVTGNGRHGTMATGKPGEERVICVDEELFIRTWDRHKIAVPNVAGLLPEVRALADSGKFDKAAALGTDEARRKAGKNDICTFVYGTKVKTLKLVVGRKYVIDGQFN